jgi:hypothetical protein
MKNETYSSKQTFSKFALFNAFANGLPFNEIGANVINSIEREDGSNNSYNVTFMGVMNLEYTVHIRVK